MPDFPPRADGRRYTLTLTRDDMGTWSQPGVHSLDDALWHLNHARRNDGLEPLTFAELDDMIDLGTASMVVMGSRNGVQS